MINLDKIRKIREELEKAKGKLENVHYLREGTYIGKIIPDTEGNLISEVAFYYRIPFLNEEGELSSKYYRYFPNNPMEVALKQLSETGVLGGQSWKYERRPFAKVMFFVHRFDGPKRPDDNFGPGVYLFVLNSRPIINAIRLALANLFLFDEGMEEEGLREVSPYFDPAVPNKGFSLSVVKGKKPTATLTTTSGIKIPPVEVPSWAKESTIDAMWPNTEPNWVPSKEYIEEFTKAVEAFRELALSGRLNPVAAERVASSKVPQVPQIPQVNAPQVSVPSTSPTPNLGVEVEQVSFTPEKRLHPSDPASGGPNKILVDPGGVPLCFGNYDSAVPKCMRCPAMKECLFGGPN